MLDIKICPQLKKKKIKLENIYRLKVSLFTYKLKNDKSNTPAVLLNILTPASEIHSYNTRYVANQNFFKPSCFLKSISIHTNFCFCYDTLLVNPLLQRYIFSSKVDLII